MEELNYIIIKDKEFAVLCALNGMNQFFGSIDAGHWQLDKQEVYTIFYQLYSKGLLFNHNEKIALDNRLAQLFNGLKKADRMLSIINPTTSENESFYYNLIDDTCVNLKKNWQDANSIHMCLVNKKDIISICEEAELLPEQKLDEVSAKCIQLSDEAEVMEHYLQICLYRLSDEAKLAMIEVQREGLNNVLYYVDADKNEKKVYLLEDLKALMAGLV